VLFQPFAALAPFLGGGVPAYGGIGLRCMRCTKDYLVGSMFALVGFPLIMCGTGSFRMWDRDRILKETLDIFQFADDVPRKILSVVIHRGALALIFAWEALLRLALIAS
jgi:hypothetical protein